MPRKSKSSPPPPRGAKPGKANAASPAKTSARSTVSGPSGRATARDAAAAKLAFTELVAEATLALRTECTVDTLIHTIHAHPTFAEAVAEAAHAVHGAAIHI